MLLWVYVFLIVICWSLTPFFKKRLIKKMGSHNLLLVNHFLITLLIIVYFIYLFTYNKCSINSLKKLDFYDYSILILISAGTVFSTVILLEAISKAKNLSRLMPTITTLVIVSTILISYYFGEPLNFKKILALFLIVSGIALLNYI